MADLIDRQAAIEALCEVCSLTGDYRKCDGYPKESTWCDEVTALRRVPSADVVEIVRCKDCKHGMYDVMCKFYWCHGVAHSANWFCADAERREDETD